MISLLSGCVKVDSTLDLREIDSINVDFEIKNKFIKKIPWQVNFENKMKKTYSNSEIFIDSEHFLLRRKGLDIKKMNLLLNKILENVSNTLKIDLNDIYIDHIEKNYFFGKKYIFNIDLNLIPLLDLENLDLSIKIINPSKVNVLNKNDKINIFKKNITWVLVPGEINQIKFTFWNWNTQLIGALIVISLIFMAYYVRDNRYELGSNLPKLPS